MLDFQPDAAFSDNLGAIHADKYKMAAIFKNSAGWTENFPKLNQRVAPPAVIPAKGKKTRNKARIFKITNQKAHFFKKLRGIL